MCIYLSRTIYTYVRCIMYMCLLNTHTWFHLYGLSVEGASKGSRVVPWIKLKEINQLFKIFYDIVFHTEKKEWAIHVRLSCTQFQFSVCRFLL